MSTQNTNVAERPEKIKKPFGFKNMRFRRGLANTIIYIVLIILSFVWLVPIIWLILQSFRAPVYRYSIDGAGNMTIGAVNLGLIPIVPATGVWSWLGYFIPQKWSLDNYYLLFKDTTQYNYLKNFSNTFIVAIFTCIFSTIIVLLTAYAFSRINFKARKPLMKFLMILGMFPGFMAMIAIYFILKGIGLLPSTSGDFKPVSNYLVALILVNTSGAAMGYYVSKGFFDTISYSIDEAAMIDGANKAQIFWHITLPLAKPIVIYQALTAFMGPWGDYIFSSTITRTNKDAWSIAQVLYSMIAGLGDMALYFTRYAAGAVLLSIPIVILFIWLQKYYVTGVTGGAVKG